MHTPLITCSLDDDGTFTVRIVDGDDERAFSFPVDYLGMVGATLVAAGNVLDISESSRTTVIPFSSADERRQAEARYREYIRQQRAAPSAGDGSGAGPEQ